MTGRFDGLSAVSDISSNSRASSFADDDEVPLSLHAPSAGIGMVLRKKAKGEAKGVEQDIVNVENTQMQDALDEFANRNECEEKQDRDFGGLTLPCQHKAYWHECKHVEQNCERCLKEFLDNQ